MFFVAIGFLLILTINFISTLLNINLNPKEYIDIACLCNNVGINYSECKLKSMNVGMSMLAGTTASLMLSYLLYKQYKLKICLKKTINTSAYIDSYLSFFLCLILTFIILIYGFNNMNQGIVNRIELIAKEGIFISLSNLYWPFILQLFFFSKDNKYKIGYLTLLLIVASIVPYRFSLFTILIFVLAIFFTNFFKSKIKIMNIWSLSINFLLILAIIFTFFINVFQETGNRSSALSEQSDLNKITQRLTFPLYQGVFAETLKSKESLPNGLDSIFKKLHLSDKKNLNEYLYSKLYSNDAAGETTSLYYGEAISISSSAPFFWIMVAPLCLFFCWALVRYFYAIDLGVLFGIAIWRASLGGVFEILPSLLIQVTFVLLLLRYKITYED